jgi:hypothetical protein
MALPSCLWIPALSWRAEPLPISSSLGKALKLVTDFSKMFPVLKRGQQRSLMVGVFGARE